ncbi:MAG: threonine synthase [Alistipes sp.]|nr:threonine synthase [Alistipes sp.]
MRYFSTRDKSKSNPFSLADAAFAGLAPDGGLFMPERIPEVDMERVMAEAEKSYADMALYLAQLLFDDVPQDKLEAVVRGAYDFPVDLCNVGDDYFTLQLFHGPTYAFKDFGARFMGRMTGLLNDEGPLTILTATSGDTGSAVAHGFYGVDGVRVVVLYPEGKVSPLQEAQMTTLDGNIHPLRVKGNFDDCQRLVKSMFRDVELRRDVRVTSANSINILRWIPQAFYYFYGYCVWRKMTGREEMEVVVPSGNYGNLTAGMLAKSMGLPIKGFVAASNANDVVPEFLRTEVYSPRASVHTVANAMDVGDPSNFERMMYLCGDDVALLKSLVKGYSYSDDEILSAISEMKERYGYLSDPHSAVGYLATKDSGCDGFWLSTAHAAKFSEITKQATMEDAPIPERLSEMMTRERKYDSIEADESVLAAYLREK